QNTRTAGFVSGNRRPDHWPTPPSSAVADRAFRRPSRSLQNAEMAQGAKRLVERARSERHREAGPCFVDLLVTGPVVPPGDAALVKNELFRRGRPQNIGKQFRPDAGVHENRAQEHIEKAVHSRSPRVVRIVAQPVLAAERMMQSS